MAFILIPEQAGQAQDEFVDHIPMKCTALRETNVYLSIDAKTHKSGTRTYKYLFTFGRLVIDAAKIQSPCYANVGFSTDRKRIRIRTCEGGRWKITRSESSPHSRLNIVIPMTPDKKQLKSSEIDIEKAENGDIIVNIERAVNEYGY